jgi:lactate permease
MLPAIATLPILFVFFALMGLRKSSATVAPLGWALAAVLAWAFWKTIPASIAVVSVAGVVWAGLVFIWGVFGAFLFLNFLKLTGLLGKITTALSTITDDRGMKVLLVMFGFAMFLGAVAPAGSTFVVAGSMLAGQGIPPLTIAAMGMFGNAPQSPYGILGVPIDALANTTTLPKGALSVSIAQLFSFFIAIAPLWIMLFLGRENRKRMIWPALIVGGVYALTQYLTVYFLGVELVNITAGLAAMGATIVLARHQRQRHRATASLRPPDHLTKIDLTCLVPFVVLILLVLLTRLVAPLKAFLTTYPLELEMHFRAGEGVVEVVKFRYLYSAGTMAVASVLISMVILRCKASILSPIVRQTLKQVLPMAVAVSSFAAMANVMKDFGMNTTMAQAMADIAGRSFPLVSPLVGMLGTSITGSTAASNIFFGGFQMEVAQRFGLSKLAVAASQVVGCTAGEIICPFNALTITSGLGLKGEEGPLMRRMVASVLLYAVLAMVGSFLFINYLAR